MRRRWPGGVARGGRVRVTPGASSSGPVTPAAGRAPRRAWCSVARTASRGSTGTDGGVRKERAPAVDRCTDRRAPHPLRSTGAPTPHRVGQASHRPQRDGGRQAPPPPRHGLGRARTRRLRAPPCPWSSRSPVGGRSTSQQVTSRGPHLPCVQAAGAGPAAGSSVAATRRGSPPGRRGQLEHPACSGHVGDAGAPSGMHAALLGAGELDVPLAAGAAGPARTRRARHARLPRQAPPVRAVAGWTWLRAGGTVAARPLLCLASGARPPPRASDEVAATGSTAGVTPGVASGRSGRGRA